MLNYNHDSGIIFLVILEVVTFDCILNHWTLFELLTVEKPPDLSWKHHH